MREDRGGFVLRVVVLVLDFQFDLRRGFGRRFPLVGIVLKESFGNYFSFLGDKTGKSYLSLQKRVILGGELDPAGELAEQVARVHRKSVESTEINL